MNRHTYQSTVKFLLLNRYNPFSRAEIDYIFKDDRNQEIVTECFNNGTYPIVALSKLVLFKQVEVEHSFDENEFTQLVR
mgnify:CR=1 FL=1|tara:strand:- start:1005 stop:1241 length:237 start_codon:yes stop_codon:yes gene_type:complete